MQPLTHVLLHPQYIIIYSVISSCGLSSGQLLVHKVDTTERERDVGLQPGPTATALNRLYFQQQILSHQYSMIPFKFTMYPLGDIKQHWAKS